MSDITIDLTEVKTIADLAIAAAMPDKDFREVDLKNFIEKNYGVTIIDDDYVPYEYSMLRAYNAFSLGPILSLEDKVNAYLKDNYKEGSKGVYLDQGHEPSGDAIQQILDSTTREDAEQAAYEYLDSVMDTEQEDIVDQILRGLRGVDGLEDADYGTVYEYCMDNGVIEDLKINDILDYDVRADIYAPTEFDDNECWVGDRGNWEHVNDQIADGYLDDFNSGLGQICKILNVNPFELGELMKKDGIIDQNNFPDIECTDGIPAADLYEEMENAPYGGTLVFTAKINLADYLKNFSTYQERGITIPEGVSYGLHDIGNGSCGFIGKKTVKPISLGKFKICDDRNVNWHSLDDICGLVGSVWSGELTFPPNERELELQKRVVDIKEAFEYVKCGNKPLKNSAYVNTDIGDKSDAIVVDALAYALDQIEITLRSEALPSTGFDIEDLIEKTCSTYKVKDEGLEDRVKLALSDIILPMFNAPVEKKTVYDYLYSIKGVLSPVQRLTKGLVESGFISSLPDNIDASWDRGSFKTEDDVNRIFEGTQKLYMEPEDGDNHLPRSVYQGAIKAVHKSFDQARCWTLLALSGAVTREESHQKITELCQGAQAALEAAAPSIMEYEDPSLNNESEPSI